MPLKIEKFQPRAQCVMAFLAGLAVFERRIIRDHAPGSEPTLAFETILRLADETSTEIRKRKERRTLGAYFRPKGEPGSAELNGKNKDEVTPLIAHFVAGLVKNRYFAAGRPLALATSLTGAKPISDLAEHFRLFETPARLEDVIKKVQPEKFTNNALQRFLDTAFGDQARGLKHPDYPSLDLFDHRTIRSEHHGWDTPDEEPGANAGLFAVIRESRGLAARKRSRVNELVRDIVWISPTRKKGESIRGFYASAVDKAAFELSDIEIEEGSVIAPGGLERRGEPIQRSRLIFRGFEHPHPLQMSHGLVAGVAADDDDNDDPVYAAWKTLIIRPNWPDLAKLEALLHQFEPSDAKTVYDILSSVRAVAVLFSNDLREKTERAQPRRQAFRSLIASDAVDGVEGVLGGFLSKDLEKRLIKTIDDAWMDQAGKQFEDRLGGMGGQIGGSKEDWQPIVEKVLRELGNYANSQWSLIEPAQIIMFKRALATHEEGHLTEDIREKILTLLDREELGSASPDDTWPR